MNRLSRRRLLSRGAAAAAAGAGLAGHAAPLLGQAPTVVTARRFRGWVTRGGGPGRTTLQDLTLRAISGRQVVVRTEATNLCYSNVNAVLALQPPTAGRGAGAGTPPAGQRTLLMLHGTFSNANGAFGALAGTDFFERARKL